MKFKLGQCEVTAETLADALDGAGDGGGAYSQGDLKRLKSFWADNREYIRGRFFAGELDGIAVTKEISRLTEVLVKAVLIKSGLPPKVAVAAVGGFGRMEQAPFSDVDMWFLAEEKIPEETIKKILYPLWDLGIKIGHSVADVDESIKLAKGDATILTTLLDARFLFGSAEVFAKFKDAFAKLIAADKDLKFVALKDAERKERHRKMGHSRYLLEPDLKQGCGGLRDMHFVIWIAKYACGGSDFAELEANGVFTAAEITKLAKVKNFLFTLRSFLHFCAGRADENLTVGYQKEIAPLMGYKAHPGTSPEERLMKRFYLSTRDVRELVAAVTAKVFPAGKEGECSSVIFKQPADILRFLQKIQNEGRDISPAEYLQIAREKKKAAGLAKNKQAIALLKDIICGENNPEYVLRILNESGMLARIIPQFRAINARAQMDAYHIYTVDEHTLKTLGAAHELMHNPDKDFVRDAAGKIKNPAALYMAAFLHDIGKNGFIGHPETGALIATKVCDLFGLGAAEQAQVVWLVRNHLVMSKTAFQRDLSDVKTINDFALLAENEENLAMLLLLTVADIAAVAPGIRTEWKDELLSELYTKTRALFAGANIIRPEDREKDLLFMRAKAATNAAETAVDITFEQAAGANKVRVYTKDRLGLFADLTGAFALAGASIISARINTVDGYALDTFMVQEAVNSFRFEQKPHAFTESRTVARLEAKIVAAAGGKIDVKKEILRRAEKLKAAEGELEKRVVIDNEASLDNTVIEINALDRRGFLFFIAAKFAELGINIVSAHISTYGKRVVDSFYVVDAAGGKITAQKRLEEVQKELYNTLDFNFKES